MCRPNQPPCHFPAASICIFNMQYASRLQCSQSISSKVRPPLRVERPRRTETRLAFVRGLTGQTRPLSIRFITLPNPSFSSLYQTPVLENWRALRESRQDTLLNLPDQGYARITPDDPFSHRIHLEELRLGHRVLLEALPLRLELV